VDETLLVDVGDKEIDEVSEGVEEIVTEAVAL